MPEDIVRADNLDTMELYKESVAGVLGAGGMSLDVIPCISLKHAGAVGFGIENVEGDDEELVSGSKGFDGVILYMHPFRVYWDKPFDERDESDPFPTCSSMGGIYGWMREDEKEVQCSNCSFSQWGSAEQGGGQACRERIRVFLLPTFSDCLPHRLDVPTTSLSVPRKYAVGLFGKGLAYWGAMTHFGAEGATNAQGIDYSKLSMTLVGQLEPDKVAELVAMRDDCVKASTRMPLESKDDVSTWKDDDEKAFDDE